MYRPRHVLRTAVYLAAFSPALAAQSTAEYRLEVDSLARLWRPMATAQAARSAKRGAMPLPRDSARFGDVIVRADSGYELVAHRAAERLAPRVQAAYGAFGAVLARDQFVVKTHQGGAAVNALSTGVADSTGSVTLRSSVFIDSDALEASWSQKVEEIIADALDPSVRAWIGATIPIDSPTTTTWNRARVELLFSNAAIARQCANGVLDACMVALELQQVGNPAFVYLTPQQRRDLILANSRIIRRAEPTRFDQCANANVFAACDSLITMIPSDAVPRPVSPAVRQSLVQFALQTGGAGAFDRFANARVIRERVEAAGKMRAESLVVRWRARIFNVRSASTALDASTAVSSLFWIAVCAGLALRSSRWR